MKCGRYVEGAINRQKVLDYVNANPGAIAPDIIKALGWDKVGGSERLGTMRGMGEITGERVTYRGVNEKGQKYNVTTYSYTANVTKTRDAEQVARDIAKNMLSAEAKESPKPQKRPAWVSGPTDPNRKPLRNQEGIGSGRSRVYVGASAGML